MYYFYVFIIKLSNWNKLVLKIIFLPPSSCPTDNLMVAKTVLGVKSLLTYLLTHSMVQSPSWAADWLAASQEILRISGNPKVHCRIHKRPPPVSILGQPNPVHIPTSHLLQINLNIIHPSTPRSPQWSPSLRFPHQDPIHPLSSPMRATCPAHLISDPIYILQIQLELMFMSLLGPIRGYFKCRYLCFSL